MRPTYTFVCPVCAKRYKSDDPGEPGCTGPNETLDEHPLVSMRLHSVRTTDIDPKYAMDRERGLLLRPEFTKEVARELVLLKV